MFARHGRSEGEQGDRLGLTTSCQLRSRAAEISGARLRRGRTSTHSTRLLYCHERLYICRRREAGRFASQRTAARRRSTHWHGCWSMSSSRRRTTSTS